VVVHVADAPLLPTPARSSSACSMRSSSGWWGRWRGRRRWR
jgi:hypothetical protein